MKNTEYLSKKRENLLRLVDKYNESIEEQHKYKVNDRENLDITREFCRPELCKYCSCGHCCTTFPCVFAPSDFIDISDVNYMKQILDMGLISISRVFDGEDDETLVLRPRGYEEKYYIVNLKGFQFPIYEDPMNPCIFKDIKEHTGCLLPSEYRPTEGLLRIPYGVMRSAGCQHINMYDKYTYKEEYQAYQEYLRYLVSIYKDKIMPIKEPTNKDIKKFINSLIK